MPYNNRPPMERFLMNLDIIEGSDCILWKGKPTRGGYGTISVGGVDTYAHRFSYIHSIGDIPAGLVTDHICRNKTCVNPSHLRLVTNRDNIVYNSGSIAALNLVKTHCKNGHEFTTENTIMMPPETTHSIPSRRCKKCKSIRDKQYKAKGRYTSY